MTRQGNEFLPPISAALGQIETATRQIGGPKPAGERVVTLSVTPSFAAEWLISRLSDFQSHHPELEVRLITDHRLPDFARTDIDLAILPGGGEWPGLSCHKLSDEDVVPICSPRLLAGENAIREPEDLCRATLIHVSIRLNRWPDWLTAAGVQHPAPLKGPKLPTTALALEAAEAGLGVALANRLFVGPHLKAGLLTVPFDFDFLTGRGYYLVYPEEHVDRPAINAFRTWLLSIAESADHAAD